MTTTLRDLKVRIFADGADIAGIEALSRNPLISGFTTNPTLMKQAGITNYEAFAKDVITCIGNRPISFEVFSDDFDEMYDQAKQIATWGEQVYVKIPITNTASVSAAPLVRRLSLEGVKLNVTAIMTVPQVEAIVAALEGGSPSYISIFAGRIADTGRDPLPMVSECLSMMQSLPGSEMIWASPREILNIFQADALGCHIITVTHDLLKKLQNVGRDLDDFSLDTVKMFYRDAVAAGFSLTPSKVLAGSH
jgi:transaldolase